MSGRFAGRGAIVTGGAGGIGLATARRLREEGAAVAILDRGSRLEAIAAAGGWPAIEVDLTDPAATSGAVERAFERLDAPCDLLVNAAGVHRVQPLDSVSPEDWDAVLAVNLAAPLRVAQAFHQLLDSPAAAIVNVSSIGADRVARSEPAAHYRASKGALNALTREMAVAWAPRVRVNAVSPGPIDTPMLRLLDDREAAAEFIDRHVPLGRVGTAGDVASAICFLLSEEASYLTAVNLPVDGGITAC